MSSPAFGGYAEYDSKTGKIVIVEDWKGYEQQIYLEMLEEILEIIEKHEFLKHTKIRDKYLKLRETITASINEIRNRVE